MRGALASEEERIENLGLRAPLLSAVLFLSCAIFIGRLWHLQVIDGQELKSFSQKNRIKINRIKAPRGIIYDRDGQILVKNRRSFVLRLEVRQEKELKDSLDLIAPIVNLTNQDVKNLLKKSWNRNGRQIPPIIKKDLTLSEVAQLRRLKYKYPFVQVNSTIIREYPLGEAGAHLLGRVGQITKDNLKYFQKRNPGIIPGDTVGIGGIEKAYDKQLRGKNGLSYSQVDARGKVSSREGLNIDDLKNIEEIAGYEIHLSIDKDLQEATYKAFFQKDKIGNRIGGAIALNSKGEVLSLVSLPSFEPNDFVLGVDGKTWKKLTNDPLKPLRNKVFQDHHMPGSVFKPIVALAALEEGIIWEDQKINSPGYFSFGGKRYHNHTKSGHGFVNVKEALETSSNVFFYKIGLDLGVDKIEPYAKSMGLGQILGIGLSGEKKGLMPNSRWKLKNKKEEWQKGENLSISIGQSFILTHPLQLAISYLTIGTLGKRYNPLLIKKMKNPLTHNLKTFEPRLLYDFSNKRSAPISIKKKNFEVVKKGLWQVGNGPRGTARWFRVRNNKSIEISGKTGTSQIRAYGADQIYKDCQERPLQQRHHGWFVGYAPPQKPEIVVAALAMHSCAGSSGAAPVVRDIIEAYYEKKMKSDKNKPL